MNKRMTIMVTALVLVFGGIIGFNLFKAFMIKRFFASYEAPPASVSSVVAKKIEWQPYISAVGNFAAINGVDVNSQASGNVVSIHFESGQYIEKDQPLIDIDDRIDQANLKFGQADMALKDINYQRQVNLYKRAATPGSSVDEAKASLAQAQANVEKTSAEIQQKHITAPFSGQLGIRQVNLGQYITPGQTSIVSLQSLDPLYLNFNLPEQLFKQLYVGQKIRFHVEEFPNAYFLGKISAINSKVDLNTHNIQVQATVPNCPSLAVSDPTKSPLIKVEKIPGTEKSIISCSTETNTANHVQKFVLMPGMFTSIEVEQKPIPDVVVLPSTSISYSLYGNSVFIIEPLEKPRQTADGKEIMQVRRVFVNTGEQQNNYTIIKSGVKPGQLVVSSGELKLQNGSHVVINNSVQLNDKADFNKLGQ
ncbi:efflux RND transporter periplasmic adaptor subunit [Legionella sp. CNM-4043-24]|uniref:efflux RND transporter periplasmic adaptor subunit n=1 Tax=Legionella sp. CNM-4043-24 TaxID=3421646 RepID=UPI00403AF197